MSKLWELISIPIVWDIYTFGVVLLFIYLMYKGYKLIAKDIKTVKAEVFSLTDYLKCLFYGLCFASGIIIILSMMLIFAINTPSLNLPTPTGDLSFMLLWPVAFLFVFVLIFPLIDFLYMASSKSNNGLTNFEAVFAKIIHKFDTPWSYLIAIFIFIIVFILPPTLLVTIFKIPFFIAFSSWELIYPLMILVYFGIRGYIGEFVANYYNYPTFSRGLFLPNSPGGLKKGAIDFGKNASHRIMYGLQIYLYFWTWLSFVQTIKFFFSGSLAVNTMGTASTVFITLAFGISGYFSRFWKRKVKFRWQDVLFAAWLIGTVGINVMINFLLSNMEKLSWNYLHWSVTVPITQGNNFVTFAPIAAVEEFYVIFYITYYLIRGAIPRVKKTFYNTSKLALIDKSAQTFDPVPMFNLIRVSQKEIRNHAKEELIKMYSRIPYKKDFKLTDEKFMTPIFDAITDYNKNSLEVSTKILDNYMENHAELISPIIIEALKSYNYDKKIRIGDLVLKNKDKMVKFIPIEIMIDLIKDLDYNIRRIGIKLLNLYEKEDLIKHEIIVRKLLKDSDYFVQSEALKLIGSKNLRLNPEIVFKLLDHPNKKIKSAAALSLTNLGGVREGVESGVMVKYLKTMINSPEWSVRGAAISALTKLGEFKKYDIPYEPILEGISDSHKEIRESSQLALKMYLLEEAGMEKDDYKKGIQKDTLFKKLTKRKEKPSVKTKSNSKSKFIEIINKIEPSDDDIRLAIFNVMEDAWIINPIDLIPHLIPHLKSQRKDIQKAVSNIIVEIGEKKPELIAEKLLCLKDEKTYLKRGIVSETIIKICKRNPQLIDDLFDYINHEEIACRINVAASLSGIAENNPEKINMDEIISALKLEKDKDVIKSLLKFLTELSEMKPDLVLKQIDEIIKLLDNSDNSVQIATLKMLIPITNKNPEAIKIELIEKLLDHDDSFIQESAIKILGNIGSQNPTKSIEILKQLLKDDDWNVKNTAMEMMSKIGVVSDEALITFMELLDDKEKWTRMQALKIIAETNPEMIPESKIKKLIKEKDADIRVLVAGILGAYKDFKKGLDLLVILMADKEQNVRERASSALVSLSKNVSMKELLPESLKYFSDETDPILQQSMALGLKRILKYESKAVKQRLIDLLTIRCEVSQDPILMKVLQELKED
jgi:HEAT repeat protein